MSPVRLLVTGASGFLGGHFLRVVAAARPAPEVIGWRREIEPPCAAPREIVADLAAASLAEVLADVRPTHILHLAGLVPPADDAALWTANVGLSALLLEAVRTGLAPFSRVLLVGSAAEYGPVRDAAISEEQPCAPTTTYGRSKLCQTLLAREYHRHWGVPAIVARPFNIIGPGMNDRTVVGAICAQLTAARDGDALKLGNLDSARDFLDVRDVAAACWELLQHGVAGEIYNVCSGTAAVIRDVARRAIELSGLHVSIESEAARRRSGDFDFSCGDGAKLAALCGWRAAVALDTSLRDTLEACRARDGAAR